MSPGRVVFDELEQRVGEGGLAGEASMRPADIVSYSSAMFTSSMAP